MRKLLIFVAAVLAATGGYVYSRSGAAPNPASVDGGTPKGGGFGGRGGFGGPRPPMTVELASTGRADLSERIMVVGNLIGAATVDVVPKTSGRLDAIHVRLGDRVSRGQTIAKVEDRELSEQVKQAEASFEVASASVRQREADLKFSTTNLQRSQNLYGRQLLPKSTLDDAEARSEAAAAQLDLARAQFAQAKARLDELRISLSNTIVASPVDGFVGRRNLDPGAFVSANTPVVSVVDIHFVRLVAGLVEKDLRRVGIGMPAHVEVDAFPGEIFSAKIARVAPILDPATRTAQIEVEVPNPAYRLKPGMYARVQLTVDRRADVLVVPRNAVVDLEGKRGVFKADDNKARFMPVQIGLQDDQHAEVRDGLHEGDKVITTGAAALRDGDTIVLDGQPPRSGGGMRGGRGPASQGRRGQGGP
ncbi:MAG: efflux RND transporter periplasmic adaptor subunit [Acidobacteria bacterium]|nr:efflux RND transporter periplasmic adaptor subunit [Acidobacteriota bacterium]